MPAAPAPTTPPAHAPTPEERQSVLAALRRPAWLKTEVLAGLVVALALIPEAIASRSSRAWIRGWDCSPPSPWR